MITSDDFLTRELRTLFLSPKTNAGGGLKYGYGWQFTSDGIIEHDGGNAGFISFLSFDPESKQHHVLLTNRSFESIYDLGKSSNKIRALSYEIWKWRNGDVIEIHPHPMQGNTSVEELTNISTSDLTFYHGDDGSTKVSSPNIPLLRKVVRTPIEATSGNNEKLIEIARHLESDSFWKFAKYCDGEMKFVAYSGLFRYGFSMMKKQVGTMQQLVPYSMKENRGYLRMIGDEATLDLVVYFNDEGKVMGVFDTGTFELESPSEMKIYQITEQSFWIDGFPYGEQPAYLIRDGSKWALQQFGRTIML